MKKIFTSIIIAFCVLTSHAQNSFPSVGHVIIDSNIILRNKLKIGIGENALTMKFVPGTTSFPPMFKFSAPAGSRPIGGSNETGGGVANEDSQPNLTCLNGSPLPGFLNSFTSMLSIAYVPTLTSIPGGQLLIGHNGVNAFFETQGTGANSTNVNHPGDLFINKFCNRNVMFFGHTTPFATNATNVVSVDGSFNVRTRIQIGDNTATNFSDLTSKLYIFTSVGAVNNGIRIKHGSGGYNGIKIATYNDATAFVISKSANIANDGPESFRIEGDGQTTISSTNVDVFIIKDQQNNNATTFKINKNGLTEINTLSNDALMVKDASNNSATTFKINKNGLTEINTTNLDAFIVKDASNNSKINFKVKKTGYAYAREINVMPVNITFPDYVFDKNYKLLSLDDLEKFILSKKHLPNISTADDVAKNGINLGEMQVKQLEKLEEAFLYIIELKKDNEALRSRIEKLEHHKN
jgi:hypothetical protein